MRWRDQRGSGNHAAAVCPAGRPDYLEQTAAACVLRCGTDVKIRTFCATGSGGNKRPHQRCTTDAVESVPSGWQTCKPAASGAAWYAFYLFPKSAAATPAA